MFELGEDLLDGIEIGAIGRQEEELGAGGADGAADERALVAAEIIHDDDVAWLEGGQEELLDPCPEGVAIDRAVDDARRFDAVAAQGGREGQCPPASVRRFGNEPVAARAPAPGAMLVFAQVSSMKTKRRGSSLA